MTPYTPCDDLCIITTYYNPCKYATRKRNFEIFSKPIIESGMSFVVVEMALEDEEFDLWEQEWIVKVRAKDIMWQKERLLNMALQYVPEKCTKIAWIDADVLFGDPDWALKASEALDKHMVIQLFDRVKFLYKNHFSPRNRNYKVFLWSARVYQLCWKPIFENDYESAGFKWYAWAIRKEVIQKIGFYDKCIIGWADSAMFLAFLWILEPLHPRYILGFGKETSYFYDFIKWADKANSLIKGSIWHIENTIFHLWHGSLTRRQYKDRHAILTQESFAPTTYIVGDKNKPLEWRSSVDNEFKNKIKKYFQERKEDER